MRPHGTSRVQMTSGGGGYGGYGQGRASEPGCWSGPHEMWPLSGRLHNHSHQFWNNSIFSEMN